MAQAITASMLYNLVQCPHRVSMDAFGDMNKRDAVSPFVQLLWDRGLDHEQEVMGNLQLPFLDLSTYCGSEKEQRTKEATDQGVDLVYSGRICAADLVGEPDLLRRDHKGYTAGDIKSGAGEEGGADGEAGTPKEHYAVQLGLYTDVLERLGKSAGRVAFVWDIHGQEVEYDFEATIGKRDPHTLWQDYEEALAGTRAILAGAQITLPAYASACKDCVWYSACHQCLKDANDLTLIPELGAAKRDAMIGTISTVREFAAADPDAYITGRKTVFRGIGPESLVKFHARALLLSAEHPVPYLREPVVLPTAQRELFFDIEVDPMRDMCYLHGIVERQNADNATENFVAFFADVPTSEAEERAFADAWSYLSSAADAAVYYYSKYEPTIYQSLARKYPGVCSESDVEALFSELRFVDMYYGVVKKATEWPTHDHSIKTIAQYLGFRWRDTHPSGAASIEWFHRWVETGDVKIKQRILEYNEDDCRATRVLVDGVRQLRLRQQL